MVDDKKHLINGILTVIGGVLIQFAFGHFYTIANMTPYILSYIKTRVDPNVNDGLVVWLSGLGYGAQGLCMPIGGYLAKKVDYRIIVAIGCLIESGSVMLTYFSVKSGFPAVIVSYAVFNGGGLGLAYSVVMEVAGSYFPDKYGLIVGIVVGGYGLSALVFTPIQTAYINPTNEKVDPVTSLFTDPALLDRVPTAFLLLGGILFGLQLIGCVLLRKRPQPEPTEVKERQLELEDETVIEDQELAVEKSDPVNLTPKEVLCRLDFYLLWVALAIIIIPISVIVSNFKYFGQTNIRDDTYLTVVVALSAVFNFGGRVIWGIISDKISFKFPTCIILVWFAALLFSFPHFKGLPEVAFKVLYLLWVAQIFFCLSGTFTLMPTGVKILFGPKYMAVNYGILFNACFVGSLIIGGVLSVVKINGQFLPLFSACGGVCLLALLIVIWVQDRNMPDKLNICWWCSTRCGRDDDDEL